MFFFMYYLILGLFIVPEKILQSGHQLAPNIKMGCLFSAKEESKNCSVSSKDKTFPSYGLGKGRFNSSSFDKMI